MKNKLNFRGYFKKVTHIMEYYIKISTQTKNIKNIKKFVTTFFDIYLYGLL